MQELPAKFSEPASSIDKTLPEPATSVDKALRLLVLLSEQDSITVSAAAERLGVARSTAHRLLAMLQKHGFAYQDAASRAYGPGRSLLSIGLAAVDSLELRSVARPELEALASEVGETVHLIILDGDRTFVLESIESHEAVRVSSRIGGSMPANTTAAGKVLLSQLEPAQVERLMGAEPLPMRTPNSIVSHAALAAELNTVRARGFAMNNSENEPDITAVAVVIPQVRGFRSAAISVAAPSMRVTQERVTRMLDGAVRTAQRIHDLLAGGR